MSKKKQKHDKSRAGRKEAGIKRVGFPLGNRPVLLVSILLLVLLAALFHQLVFARKVLVSADAVAPLGFASIAEESVKEGGPYPLWNPYVFLGMPSFGSLTYTPYVYFPDLILKGVHTVLPFLPPMTWLLIYYFLAGLFTYLLLKERGLGLEAGLFAAVAFMLTPDLVAIGSFGHGSKLITCAFIPVVMLLAARVLTRGDALSFGLLALAAGLQLLRAHVQIVYYTWMALGLYCLIFVVFKSPGDAPASVRVRRVFYVAGALAVALAFAAVLYLPVHDYSAFSSRGAVEGGGMAFGRATDWSFSPVEMMTFLVPSWLGFGGSTYWGSMPFTDYPNYMGILPLVLALIGLLSIKRKEVMFFSLLGLFALLVSFGKHFEPLYRLLYAWLPYFNKFRVPVMILVLLQFSIAALAAYGIERVIRHGRSPGSARSLERLSFWMGIGLLLVWFVWAAFGESVATLYKGAVVDSLRDRAALANVLDRFSSARAESIAERCFQMVRNDVLIIGGIGFAGLMSVYLFLKRRLTIAVLIGVLACLTVVDLWRIDARIVNPMVGERSSVTTASFRDDVIDFLEKDESLYRIFPTGREFNENRFAAFGIASVGGYHAAKPSLYEKFYDSVIRTQRITPGILGMLNVKYLLSSQYLAPGNPVTLVHDGSLKIYELLAFLPRAYLVGNVSVLENEKAVLDSLASPWFDPSSTALLIEPTPIEPVSREGSSLRIVSYGLNRIDMEARIARPCFMVLSDLYYPDWNAEIDGARAKIYRTDFLLRGVPLGEGSHKIRFFYDSRSLRTGMTLSILASAIILVSISPAAVKLVRRRRQREIACHNSDVQ